jgi:hypothetical protein
MKELLDIISIFSEERKENNKQLQVLKHENKKLKHYKANYERDVSARNLYNKYTHRDYDNELIDKIVNQELGKLKKMYAKEKESLLNHWNNEIQILTESVHKQEIENKHLVEIIYNKDQEIEGAHKRVENMIISLRKENKRLKAKQNDYECVISDKNCQIHSLSEAIRGYQYTDHRRHEKLKSMSEIRSSRIDYRSSRESLVPSGTFYTSRNQMHSSRVESFSGCHN